MDKEAKLLDIALQYEEGHKRRSEHILKVYSLTSMLAALENIPFENQTVVKAAAIVHDIAIKACKEYCGQASLEMQQQLAPDLVTTMMLKADYPSSLTEDVIDLVLNHHQYDNITSPELQILIEADLIVNIYEEEHFNMSLDQLTSIFKTKSGTRILNSISKIVGI